MKTRHLTLAAIAAVAAVLTLQPIADGASPQLRFVVVEGPAVTIPAASVSDEKDYDVRCPKGYVATGPGVSLGTTQLVFADPDAGGRGYSFAFLNNSSAPATNVSASVVCMRGTGVRVRAASLNQEDRRLAVERARRSLEQR
jgi:hypothetical protein